MWTWKVIYRDYPHREWQEKYYKIRKSAIAFAREYIKRGSYGKPYRITTGKYGDTDNKEYIRYAGDFGQGNCREAIVKEI